MAKRKRTKPAAEEECRYAYIKAYVSTEGTLVYEYQIPGKRINQMKHEEDVGEWEDQEIEELVRLLLYAQPDEKVEVLRD